MVVKIAIQIVKSHDFTILPHQKFKIVVGLQKWKDRVGSHRIVWDPTDPTIWLDFFFFFFLNFKWDSFG